VPPLLFHFCNQTLFISEASIPLIMSFLANNVEGFVLSKLKKIFSVSNILCYYSVNHSMNVQTSNICINKNALNSY
jgi:hypothetical protein